MENLTGAEGNLYTLAPRLGAEGIDLLTLRKDLEYVIVESSALSGSRINPLPSLEGGQKDNINGSICITRSGATNIDIIVQDQLYKFPLAVRRQIHSKTAELRA
ncbi:hypothetical protein HPP92_023107 [Vanilla planifolia]|uniref:Uncharacterized protein n=1 Tax=Vanilla planifolia TaxID=51239 RepID=A0A835PUI6_VANPL|nr:hypothetical protein HPP92_023107 [Vanilla planifolia]